MSLARLVVALSLCLPAFACDSSKASSTKAGAAAQSPGQSFGAGVKLAESTKVSTLLADPKAHVGKTVRVDAPCLDCGGSVRVEMRDEAVLAVEPAAMVGYAYSQVGGPPENRPFR